MLSLQDAASSQSSPEACCWADLCSFLAASGIAGCCAHMLALRHHGSREHMHSGGLQMPLGVANSMALIALACNTALALACNTAVATTLGAKAGLQYLAAYAEVFRSKSCCSGKRCHIARHHCNFCHSHLCWFFFGGGADSELSELSDADVFVPLDFNRSIAISKAAFVLSHGPPTRSFF